MNTAIEEHYEAKLFLQRVTDKQWQVISPHRGNSSAEPAKLTFNRGLAIAPKGHLKGLPQENPRDFFQEKRSVMLLQGIDHTKPEAVTWFAQCFAEHAGTWWTSITRTQPNGGFKNLA